MQLFYELIRVAVGSWETLSLIPTSGEWSYLLAASQKHSLVGIAFQGLPKLYSSNPEQVVNLPVPLKMNWMAMSCDIQRGNSLILERARELSRLFAGDGYRSTVLKGVGCQPIILILLKSGWGYRFVGGCAKRGVGLLSEVEA